MVGHDDARRAGVDGQPSVFRGDDSLDEDGHGGDALQPLDVLPAQGAVDLAGDVRRQPGVPMYSALIPLLILTSTSTTTTEEEEKMY